MQNLFRFDQNIIFYILMLCAAVKPIKTPSNLAIYGEYFIDIHALWRHE